MNEYLKKHGEFIALNGKTPIHSLDKTLTYDQARHLSTIGVLVNRPYVILDVDNDKHFHKLKKICKALNVNTWIMHTERGGHFWFTNETPLPNHVKTNTALTLPIDVRSYGKKSYVVVKRNNVWRDWIKSDENISELPYYLTPIAHSIHLADLKEGDGRNDALYRYILTLNSFGYNQDQIKFIYQIINDYIFDTPLPQKELDTILRNESFENLRPQFFNKNRFLHHVFSKFLCTTLRIYNLSGRLFIYQDEHYDGTENALEQKMIYYIPQLTYAQRQEVYKYLLLLAPKANPAPPHFLGVENGVLDIRTRDLIANSPDLFVQYKIAVEFNPHIKECYAVEKFMQDITLHDEKLETLLWELIGYCLYTSNSMHKAFILYGTGSNGKSTFLKMIKNFLGMYNISSLSLKDLNHNFKLSEITGKLVNIGDDISDDMLKDSSIFKKLISGDSIVVDRKNKNPYELSSTTKLIFACNDLPGTKDKSYGMFRRLVIIPFNMQISPSDPRYDPFLEEKLSTPIAKSFILNKALEAFTKALERNSFTDSESVSKVMEQYKLENNNVFAFLHDNDIDNINVAHSYNDYKIWCLDNKTLSFRKTKFTNEVLNTGLYTLKTIDGICSDERVWHSTGAIKIKKGDITNGEISGY